MKGPWTFAESRMSKAGNLWFVDSPEGRVAETTTEASARFIAAAPALLLDADHEWALWFEKWTATLDLVGSGNERLQRVLNNWPHIEIPTGKHSTDKRTADPGAPTCLRCKLEALAFGGKS